MMRGTILALLLTACSSETPIQVSTHVSVSEDDMGAIVEKKTGWQQSGTLTTGDVNKKVTMQADFAEPGYYTIQFGVIPPVDAVTPANSGVFRAVAEIQWSVEGSTVTRRVTIGNGSSISGTGQAAKVTIFDNSAAFGFNGNDYIVWCQCAKGSRPSENQPPVLAGDLVQVNGGASSSIAIPQNAGVISVEVMATPVAVTGFPVSNLVCSLRNPVGTILKTFIPGQVGFVAVPPGATELLIENLSAADNYRLTPTWGIDG